MNKKDNNLYFIPIIAKAFEHEELDVAFKIAITEIIELGQLPGYDQGFQQFEEFINAGLENLQIHPEYFRQIQRTIIESILLKIATDTFDGPEDVKDRLLKSIHSNIELKEEFEFIKSNILKNNDEHQKIEVQLFRETKFTAEFDFSDGPTRFEFHSIKPGFYSLKLSNGRILWQDEINSEEIIWSKAFPGKEYKMAADTKGIAGEISRSESLLAGSMTLVLYPGLEAGKMVITFSKETSEE